MSKFADYLRAQLVLTRALNSATDALDLRPVGAYILYGLLTNTVTPRASTLARHVGMEATRFTPALDQLEKTGWICREADPTDRRAVRIVVTDKALDARQAIYDAVASMEASVYELWLGVPSEVALWMQTLASKLRTQSSAADLRPGDELKWTDGLWYQVLDAPLALERDLNGNPVSYSVPVVSVKGRERNTFTVEAATWLMVRRDVV